MNTTENNKLLAEFMGAKVIQENNYFMAYNWQNNQIVSMTPTTFWDENPEKTLLKIYETLLNPAFGRWGRFHSDWNWLMEVIDTIKAQILEEYTLIDKIDDALISIDIEAVYAACLEFIEWYNKNGGIKN